MTFLIASCIFFAYFYRWIKKPSDSTRIRFVAPNGSSLLENGYVYPDLGAMQTVPNEAPLIMGTKDDKTVLIVYAHDSKAHSDAVLALAELLRDVFNMNVYVCFFIKLNINFLL